MGDLHPLKEIHINSKIHSYKVVFTTKFQECLQNNIQDGDIIIVDNYVKENYGIYWAHISVNEVIISASEIAKTYNAIEKTIEKVIDFGFRRKNKLIAIGGGITQDITSFIASILYRGVDWMFFPTNLLSQSDSCIGSKLSVNFGKYKNLIGGFYPPKSIFIDTSFLKTLNREDVLSGLGEMLHYYLIDGQDSAEIFRQLVPKLKHELEGIEQLIFLSLSIKKKMIEIDEFDQGPRNIFNYGHTFGHALESVTNYSIPHGIAVSIGIDLANLVSSDLGYISIDERNEMRKLCQMVYAGIDLPEIQINEYCNALKKDKKNEGNTIGLILSKGIGKAFKRQTQLESIYKRIQNFFEDKQYLKDF